MDKKVQYVCINDISIARIWDVSIDFYKKGEIYWFITVDLLHYLSPKKFWLNNIEIQNFIPLCEFREKRINSIFSNNI